jgi:hypothetical protein
MHGKYANPLKFHLVRARRAAIRRVISPFRRWRPLDDPESGYTILIGCNAPLAAMLGANLQMLSQQDLTDCDKIIVVFDRPAGQIEYPVERVMRERFPSLPLEFLYYPRRQAKVFGALRWAWIYSWASWMQALAACRTRYALLHDFDAMLLRRDIIQERYREISRRGAQWCGIKYYKGNGVVADDGLVTTFEMMLDVPFVRERFRPIDAFNHVAVYNGRTVDFDTFLYAQTRGGKSFVLPIAEADMVHPSQVICQFSALSRTGRYAPPNGGNLWFVPYFLYLSGEPASMERATADLLTTRDRTIPFFGGRLDASLLTQAQFDRVVKQVGYLERAVAGEVRPDVQAYLDAIGRLLPETAEARPRVEVTVMQTTFAKPAGSPAETQPL